MSAGRSALANAAVNGAANAGASTLGSIAQDGRQGNAADWGSAGNAAAIGAATGIAGSLVGDSVEHGLRSAANARFQNNLGPLARGMLDSGAMTRTTSPNGLGSVVGAQAAGNLTSNASNLSQGNSNCDAIVAPKNIGPFAKRPGHQHLIPGCEPPSACR